MFIGMVEQDYFPVKRWRWWRDEDIVILKNMIKEGFSPEEIGEKIERTTRSIQNKMKELGMVSRTKWTENDIKKLNYWNDKGLTNAQIAKKLGRTTKAVKLKKTKLNQKNKSKINWTLEKIAELEDLYTQGLSIKEISVILGVTDTTIYSAASKFGISKGEWGEEDIIYLKKAYPDKNISLDTMVKKLGRTERAIRNEAMVLGVYRGSAHPGITLNQYNFIIKNYSTMATARIAAEIDVPVENIQSYASKSKLKKKRIKNKGKKTNKNYHWSKEDLQFLLNNYQSIHASKFYKYINRTEQSVKDKLKNLGLIDSRLRIYCKGNYSFYYLHESEIEDKLKYIEFWNHSGRVRKIGYNF